MPNIPSSSALNSAEGIVLVTVLAAYGLALLVRLLRRTRPDFRAIEPLAVGFALRLAAMAGISASGIGATLRGGDEIGFLANAHQIASTPFTSSLWVPGGQYHLHEIVFAIQIKFADFGESALRVTQVGIALCGLLLLATAVHDLAGPRAGRLTLWVLALEPGNIFFNQILHKEPLMVLATGLVALGGARAWRRVDPLALITLTAGSGVAILTRPYAGWLLASAAVLIVLHATVRDATKSISALAVLAGVLVGIAVAVPVIVQVSSHQSLQDNLQSSQNANTSGVPAADSGPNGNNLALERVDYSTRGAIVTNLPTRIFDLVLRPYPWQLANTSERLGVLGTLVALATLAALLRYGLRARRELVRLAGPLLYPLSMLVVAYGLSVGNAGTGFRYRSHLVTLAVAIAVVLHEHCLARELEPLGGLEARRRRRGVERLPSNGRRTRTAAEPNR